MPKPTILIFLCLLLSAPSVAAGQDGIAVLLSADIAPYRLALTGFQETLEQSGQALRIEEHSLAGKNESLMQRISREKPRVLLALGPEAAQFAVGNFPETPLVVSMVLHPQALKARNATWVSLEIPALTRLKKIRLLLPEVHTVGLLYSADSVACYREILQACEALGLEIAARRIESGKDLPEAFADLAPRIDLFLMIPDTRIYFPKSIRYLLVAEMKIGVPVVGLSSSYTRAGALLSFEADYPSIGRQAGEMALRILKGQDPADIRPADPREIRTSLNLVVAKRLQIKLADNAVGAADEIFQ